MGLLDDLDRTLDVPEVEITAVDLPSQPPGSIGSRRPSIPGYEVLHVLGKGGEGTVWEAVEKKLERHVAIKIHSSHVSAEPTSNLWTEARVAARIGDPSIVTVLDVGLTLDGRRYYAMELVRGTDVAELLKSGPLTPRRALEIAGDVARAVAAAHEHGVVHRDLKPRNVIVDVANRARVVDFGIALDLRSGGDRLAGMVAGSPKYMAPEQIRGGTVGPFTDIWAIGVLLFEMLTGVSPFERKTFREIIGAIGIDDPGVPSARVKGIHRDIDAIVRRCLEPARSDRFPSAAALHESIRAVLEGQRPVGMKEYEAAYQPRPSLPESDSTIPLRQQADKHFSWTRRLDASPHELWPFVSDTQSINQAIGLPPIVIETVANDGGHPIQVGKRRLLGMPVEWQEFPFEWVVDQEHSKLRYFTKGPLHAVWNSVTLTPRADGGTDLTHEISVKTRNWLGRVATTIELDRLATAIHRHYSAIDDQLVGGRSSEEIDAHPPTSSQRSRVEHGMKKLRLQGFTPRLVEALQTHLLRAPDRMLGAIRPFELADRWQTSRPETVDALLHASNHGLLVPKWSVLCPVCRVASSRVAKLEELGQESRCATCDVDFQTDLEESVELVFVPARDVREISPKHYCFGPPAARPHVAAQKNVAAGAEVSLRVELEPGAYRIVGAHSRASCELLATATGFLERAILEFDGKKIDGGAILVHAGPIGVTLRNTGATEELFRLEKVERPDDRFSAARALTHPTFRKLFTQQLPKAGTCLPVKELSFVFVRFPDLELVEKLGDAAAALELGRWKEAIAEEAARFGGSVVPSTLSLVAIAFANDAVAIRSAFAIHEANRGVAIAVHQGSCVGVTHNGRLELFGETLRRGEALVQDCPGGHIGVSDTMMAKESVAIFINKGRRVREQPPRPPSKHPKLVLLDNAA